MLHIYPQPDEQGIAEFRRVALESHGRDYTEAEAREALGKIMRYLYHLNWVHGDSKPPEPEG